MSLSGIVINHGGQVMDARMPEEFFEELKPYLPPEELVGPQGGRPRKSHWGVMKVIWFVLCTGSRWQDVPLELGCSGRTAHRRLRAWEEQGVWDQLHAHLLKLLRTAGLLDPNLAIVDAVIVRAFGGGEETGPSPVHRGKPGSKHTLLVDRHGVPMAIRTAGANASDHTQILPIVLLDFPHVGGKPGRPKERPDKLYADRGYDSDDTRALLRWLGIEPVIGRRNTEHGSGLGKVRWVVERTIGWFKGLRRLRVRYDRLLVIQEAWNTLAAAVLCFRIAHEACPFVT
jgi:transposase